MRNVSFIIVVCLLWSVNVFADDYDFQQAFSAVFAQSTHKVKLGHYKGQELKGKYSGMGVINLKSGGIYYGDVADGQPEGYGVMLCPDGIKSCTGAGIYAGRFKKGQMDGNGVCYTPEGSPLCKGRFSGGVLSQRSEVSGNQVFMLLDVAEKYQYVGEVQSSKPNGLGAIIFRNGDIVLSNFQNGQRDGLGVVIAANGEWQTENVVAGQTKVLSTSEHYQNLSKQNKVTINQMLTDIAGAIARGAVDISNNIKDIASTGQGDADESTDIDDDFVEGKVYTKKEYEELYEKNLKLANRQVKKYCEEKGRIEKKRINGTLSAGDTRTTNSTIRLCLVSYNTYTHRMEKIYREAKKHGYVLKKADIHGKSLTTIAGKYGL